MAIKITRNPNHNQTRLSAFLGGIICLVLAGFAFYAAFGEGEVAGGVPFIPNSVNRFIGMALFAFGGVLSFLFGVLAFYDVFTLKKETNIKK